MRRITLLVTAALLMAATLARSRPFIHRRSWKACSAKFTHLWDNFPKAS
jgi:hypothetical protein